MKAIIAAIKKYFYETNRFVLASASILTGVLVFCNYYFRLDEKIGWRHSFFYSFICRYVIFLLAFAIPYVFYALAKKQTKADPVFILLILLSPAIFSLKIALDIPLHFSDDIGWNIYWNNVFYWPLRLAMLIAILLLIWKMIGIDQPFYGITTSNLKWKPYLMMLLVMLPLIAIASTQPDFLAMYPKLKMISGIAAQDQFTIGHKLLFELSYGTDFISIELFFRGFLILAFMKWAGKNAILPMACFYCLIHMGKPLGECISSYFGGMLLGIVVYETRSIFGGLIVHLGIAWMMEVGGYFGAAYFNSGY